jgi:glycosyltransferase involved in cell wall biosynthesis
MDKKNCAIVFGITRDYTFALANVLIGMKRHCKIFWDDIVVFHTGLSADNQKLLNGIMPCSFVDFKNNEWCKKVMDAVPPNRYSIATFFRYECFNLLKSYRKVIWSDVDILVQADFSDILKYGEASGYACAISHEFTPVEANFSRLIDGYDMFIPTRNAGFLLLSDKLLKHGDLAKWCYEMTIEYADILRMSDQGILNLMLQDFAIEPEELDIFKYQCFTDWNQALDASVSAIIHAYSPRKFWNNHDVKVRFPEWTENNEIFKELALNAQLKSDDKAPVISVIMSVHDRIKYLDESVVSILNQTFSDFEFIIVIEFSDATAQVEKKLLEYKDDRIVIIKNSEKLGFSASLNVAIDNAKGKYIARMDDDDISYPERFQRQLNFLYENPDISMCGTHAESFMLEHNTWAPYPSDPELVNIRLLFSNVLCHPAMMMRKKDIVKYNLRYDKNVFTEDYDLWARAIEHVKISNVPEILLKYRLSGENATWRHVMKMHNAHLDVMKMQFIKYLNITPTNDELHLINGRIDLLTATYVHSQDSAHKIRSSFKEKIVEANKITKFYNQEKLEEYIYGRPITHHIISLPPKVTWGLKSAVKRLIKKCFRPFYRPIINRLDSRLERLKHEIVNDVANRLQ